MENTIGNNALPSKPRLSPRDFFLYIATLITLVWSSISLIALAFEIINYAYPDTLAYYIDPYSTQMRFAIASLIIIFPVFLIVSWFINRDLKNHPEKKGLTFRRWLIYFILFVSGLAIIIDLITLVNTFLGGDTTARFLLKVLSVFVVAAGIFGYYIYDLRRDIGRNSAVPTVITWLSVVVVIAALVSGFLIMGTPGDQRLIRYDQTKVNDLSSIQNQIVYDYWQPKRTLPTTLNELNDAVTGFQVPTDSQTGASYEYRKISDLQFELCANFNKPSVKNGSSPAYPAGQVNSVWDHQSGRQCFTRTIDPSLFPPKTAGVTPTPVKGR
jgi:hypothetical protein